MLPTWFASLVGKRRKSGLTRTLQRESARLSLEVLEPRVVLAGSKVALVLSGFGGADVPPRVVQELVRLGYEGIDPGGIVSTWNGSNNPGGFGDDPAITISKASFQVPRFDPDDLTPNGFPDLGIPSIPQLGPIELPTGLPQIEGINLGVPNTSTDYVATIAAKLRVFDNEDTIVLIGHSLGGDTVLKIAEALEGDVEIDLLATLDPVGFVPANATEIANGLADETTRSALGVSIPQISFDRLGNLGSFSDLLGTAAFEVAAASLPVRIPVNDAGEFPGLFSASSLVDAPVPTNVKYLYNRWQQNDLWPADFLLARDLTGRNGIPLPTGIAEQGSQNAKSYSYLPCTDGSTSDEQLLSCLAILAPPPRQILNPFTFATVTNLPNPNAPFSPPLGCSGTNANVTMECNVPDGIRSNPFTTNAQLHHDFPKNSQVQDELIGLLSAITPPTLPDVLESNDSISKAIFLGSASQSTLATLTLDKSTDVDYFRIRANQTGKLVLTVPFTGANGRLVLEVQDQVQTVLSRREFTPGGIPRSIATISAPVVSQQEYYIRISSVPTSSSIEAQFCYDLEIENFAAPVPDGVILSPDSDNGISRLDSVTMASSPVIYIQADLQDFADDNHDGVVTSPPEIAVLTAALATAGVTSGAAVEVFANGVSQGFADAVPGTGDTLFTFTLADATLGNGIPVNGGTINLITAAVRIFDGQRTLTGLPAPVSDRTRLSPPLRLLFTDVDGPRISSVSVTGSPTYDLLAAKQALSGPRPTPPINGLTVEFSPTYDVDNNVTVPYEDIGGTGTAMTWTNDDDDFQQIPIGFNFPFFDGTFANVFVATNGILTFGSGLSSAANVSLNASGGPSAPIIAPFWDDLDIDSNRPGRVFFETRGVPNDQRLIVQWRNVEFFNADGGGTVDFEAVLFENGTIEFRYNDVTSGVATEDGGIGATIGIRNSEPTATTDGDVHQVSLGSPALADGKTIRFSTPFDPAQATNVGNYSLNGDANGAINIATATVMAPNKVLLTFAQPLPDDRFTFSISDALTDLSRNALDGESSAAAPGGSISLPSGNGVAGGDFVARFTVDSRPELAVWSAGSVYIDTNGNFSFDPDNGDSTNRDIVHTLGFTTDHIFAGNFVAGVGGTADGFDKLADYGRIGTSFRWLIDFNNDGVPDSTFTEAADFKGTGIPIAGNFDGNAVNGDEIGLFTGAEWIFDSDHDFLLSNNAPGIPSDIRGYPFVGDFDGNGSVDLGTYDVNTNTFHLSLNPSLAGPSNPETHRFQLANGSPFIGVRERPVVGDINADGMDDIGLFVPDRSGQSPSDVAEWYFLVSGMDVVDGAGNPVPDGNPDPVTSRIVANVIDFTHTPFGPDVFAKFGSQFGIPIVANFDPPLTDASSTAKSTNTQSNPLEVIPDTEQPPSETSTMAAVEDTGAEDTTPTVETIAETVTDATNPPEPSKEVVPGTPTASDAENFALEASESVIQPPSVDTVPAQEEATPDSELDVIEENNTSTDPIETEPIVEPATESDETNLEEQLPVMQDSNSNAVGTDDSSESATPSSPLNEVQEASDETSAPPNAVQEQENSSSSIPSELAPSMVAESPQAEVSPVWQNASYAEDADGDGQLAPIDALLVINEVERRQSFEVPDFVLPQTRPIDAIGYFDVNGDGSVTPIDALIIINRIEELNEQNQAEGEFSSSSDVGLLGAYRVHDAVQTPVVTPRRSATTPYSPHDRRTQELAARLYGEAKKATLADVSASLRSRTQMKPKEYASAVDWILGSDDQSAEEWLDAIEVR